MWNSTQCVGATYWPTNGWEWRPQVGASLPWSLGIQWNVTVPIYSAPNSFTGANQSRTIFAINHGVILATTGTSTYPQNYQMEVAYSATTGAFLWVQNRSVAQAPGETNFDLMLSSSTSSATLFRMESMWNSTKRLCSSMASA